MNEIKLTEEQKRCVEYPLDQQVLTIDADPGTGKTEILRHRVKFIHQQNKKERKAVNRAHPQPLAVGAPCGFPPLGTRSGVGRPVGAAR